MSHETVSWNVVRSDSLRCIILNRKHVLKTMSYIRRYNEVYHKTVPSSLHPHKNTLWLWHLPPIPLPLLSPPLPLCETISNNTKYFTAASFYIFTFNNFHFTVLLLHSQFSYISWAKRGPYLLMFLQFRIMHKAATTVSNQCLLLLKAALGHITKYDQTWLTFWVGHLMYSFISWPPQDGIATDGFIHFYPINLGAISKLAMTSTGCEIKIYV